MLDRELWQGIYNTPFIRIGPIQLAARGPRAARQQLWGDCGLGSARKTSFTNTDKSLQTSNLQTNPSPNSIMNIECNTCLILAANPRLIVLLRKHV